MKTEETQGNRQGPTSFFPIKTDDALRRILGVNPREHSEATPKTKKKLTAKKASRKK